MEQKYKTELVEKALRESFREFGIEYTEERIPLVTNPELRAEYQRVYDQLLWQGFPKWTKK